MPISDSYVVQYILQATVADQDSIAWREKEPDGYLAELRGVQLELESIHTRLGARLQLTLTCGAESIYLYEPPRTGVFVQRYASEEEQRLVQLMRDLNTAVVRQCAARRNRSPETLSHIRESIYGRLIGAAEVEVEPVASR